MGLGEALHRRVVQSRVRGRLLLFLLFGLRRRVDSQGKGALRKQLDDRGRLGPAAAAAARGR